MSNSRPVTVWTGPQDLLEARIEVILPSVELFVFIDAAQSACPWIRNVAGNFLVVLVRLANALDF